MLTFSSAIVIDLAATALATWILVSRGRISHSHPATIYLIFHVYSFSWRLIAVGAGATPLFGEAFWGPGVDPIREEEYALAALLADGVLLGMTLGWLLAARRYSTGVSSARPSWFAAPISAPIVFGVSAVVIPIGLVSIVALGQLPGVDNARTYEALGDWGTSSYLLIAQSWAGLALIGLIYLRGFRWWLTVATIAYLLIMAYQGFHRYRAIIPAILLVQIYLDRNRMRWPTKRATALLLALALVFFPLKNIGRALQGGASTSDLLEIAANASAEVVSGSAPDQTFLDQLASCVALVDQSGALFLGRPYLAIVTLPVPRQWWPDKPTLSEHIRELSTASRPMLVNGMVLTFIGDLYANFSFVGLFVVAPLFAFFLGRSYFLAVRAGFGSIGHFAYLLIACNLIQVYRDGLMSIVMFTLVNMMPLTVIVIIHVVRGRRPSRLHL